MQHYNLNIPASNAPQTNNAVLTERQTAGLNKEMQESARAAERARLRQGIMHVRIRHFYCTLEEMFDPALRGQAFVVGTGTGRPNEPGRVIDVSPAALRLGVSPGMPLRRAYRLAPRARFLPASYDQYQPVLLKLRERYRVYSRIIETVSIADAFIDLRGCELSFDSPVTLAERLCTEIGEMRLTALIGIANGKAIAELAALMSRKDGRRGVLYIPSGREASFVQTLPLSMLLQMRAAGTGIPGAMPELGEQNGHISRPPEIEGKRTEEGLSRRLGRIGGWLYQVASGQDSSLVVPDAPPLSQNARVRLHHAADADETCAAIRKLANYLGERLREQRLKGRIIALMLWPSRLVRQETRKLVIAEDGEEVAVTSAEDTVGGQMILSCHTDDPDVIAHHVLMLFAHYHHPGNSYLQVQVRIGDIMAVTPTYYPPPARARGRPTRKL